MAELPFLAATIEVASSGRDVPAATKVKPTTVSLTPILSAISVAASTNKFPPNTRPANPNMT